MKRFFTAIGFLTILPVPERWKGPGVELSRSVPFMPLVGALMGGAAALLDVWFSRCLPPTVSTVLVLVSLIAISGGLHLDGLADTADGFLSSRPRSRILEIMKDPRSGPMGVTAIVCLLSIKVSCLSAIVSPALRGAAIFLMPIAGRAAIVLTMSLLRYARPEGGTGTAFVGGRSWFSMVFAVTAPACLGFWIARGTGVAAALGGLVAALSMSGWSWRKIGGWTGDTLGATCEIAEAFSLLALLACSRAML